MAADQRRKRLNTSNFVGCTSREQQKVKKKKVGLPQDDLDLRSNISLKWDDKNKTVIAKRDQIGISRRDLAPFFDAFPHFYGNLADVFTVPREIFELENLVDILSYEVWQTHLSENQRNILMQFLPKGAEPDNIIQELLVGNNFHFGNPFLKWGTSVCSGELHPDDILQSEQSINAKKNMYYSELQKYHNDMIENLQMWKERWNRCEDPEEEVVQKIWRSRKQPGKSFQLSETRYRGPEENQVGTPESYSWATSEKACSTDNNPSLTLVPGETQRGKGFSVCKPDNSPDRLKAVEKLKKSEKLHKRNIQHGDGAKYMSYIKVSKEQHQRVKSTMKHTSNSIQPRSLNNVLGNLDSLHVQPFEIFEEEEKKKLHEYWLKLANKDIPAGFANWSKRKIEVWKLTKSLAQEIEERLKFEEEDEERENSHDIPPELIDNREAVLVPTTLLEDEERENSDSFLQDQTKDEIDIALEDEEKDKTGFILQGQVDDSTGSMEEDDESISLSPEDQHIEKIVPIHNLDHVNGMNVDSHHNIVIAKVDDYPPVVAEYSRNMNHVDITVNQEDPPESMDDDVWSAVTMPGSYYHSNSSSHGYVSSSELPLVHPQVMEGQPAPVIDLEVNTRGGRASGTDLMHGQSEDLSFYSSYPNQGQNELQEKDSGKDMLHRQPDDVSYFSSYTTQDRNELLESFFKGQGSLAYPREEKRMGLDLQHDNLALETSQFSGQFRDQVNLPHPLEMRQKRMSDLYVDQNIQETVYSNEGRYSISKHLPSNIQDWGVSSTRMLSTSQSHMNSGDLISQNWFPGDNQGRGGWSGMEGAVGPSRSIGSESNSDQSLFGVLSECNELRSGTPYDSMASAERFMQSAAYNVLGGGIPVASDILQQNAANPLNNFLSSHEAGAGHKANNLGWMGISHQNSGLQESMSKPFLRSWNQ